jgi:hypothetical protein
LSGDTVTAMPSPMANGRPAPTEPRGSRRRTAFRRLPLTLGVLLLVVLAVAGLAYVAAQPSGQAFQGTLVNNLRLAVNVGSCADKDCKDGGSFDIERVEPGKTVVATFQAGSAVNPFVITTLTSRRVGCLFLRYAKVPKIAPVVPLTRAQHC